MNEMIKQADFKKPVFICVIGLIALLLFSGWAEAEPAKALEKIKAKPDVIIMTGDAFAVQKVLSVQIKNYPDIAAVSAIKFLSIVDNFIFRRIS